MCKVPNENLNSADNLTDENLCRMVASGDRRAEEILFPGIPGWFAPAPGLIFWLAATVRI